MKIVVVLALIASATAVTINTEFDGDMPQPMDENYDDIQTLLDLPENLSRRKKRRDKTS